MPDTSRPPIAVVLGVFCGVLIAACAPARRSEGGTGPSAASQPTTPKRIVAAIMGDPPTLSNTINSAGAAGIPGASELEKLVNAGLSVVDTQGTLHPQLAEAVPSTTNGFWMVYPDGRMETTWRLRPGARWHDGAAVTSADLLFSTRVAQDRDLAIFHEITFDAVETVAAPDERTFVARWKRPYLQADALFATSASLLPVPRHILERPYLEAPMNLPQLAFWHQDFVGTGPFRIREWTRGSHIILVANDHYVLGRPKLDEIEVRLIPDQNTLGANILAGAVELTLGRNLSLDEALQVAEQWRDGRIDRLFRSWIVMYPQLLNPSPAVIGDVRFRRALLHAVDRQAMADSLLRPGLSTVAHNFVGPNEPGFAEIQDSLVRYDYDPRRARQIIETEIGLARAADSTVRGPSGQQLTLEIRNRGIEIGTKSMFVTADYWKQLGLGAETVVVPTQRAQDRPYMATFPGFLLYNQPAEIDFLKRIHSSQTPTEANNFVGQNNSRYVSPELDALIDRHFVTIPRNERIDVLRQVSRLLTDQVLLLGLFYNPETALIGARLIGPAAGPPWNAHEWDVR